MRKFIFITNEGYTYQPKSQSTIPDIENMQVVGFGQGKTAKDALKDMIRDNKHLIKTKFNEIIGIELKDSKSKRFYLKEN